MILTRKQTAFLDMLVGLVEEHGIPPTIREIQMAGHFASTRSVAQYLDVLQAAGHLVRCPGPRNIRILQRTSAGQVDSAETVAVPVVGTVAAGMPLLAEENIIDHRPVATNLLRRGSSHFLLKVRGDSMDRAGIGDGDFVLVRQQSTGLNGDRVVALIDQDATVKRLRIGSDTALLEPVSSNATHKPIVVGREFRIQGVVIATIPREVPP